MMEGVVVLNDPINGIVGPVGLVGLVDPINGPR